MSAANKLCVTFVVFCCCATALASEDISVCGQAHHGGNGDCGPNGGKRFFFDTVTKRCQPFAYLGCGGTENRFGTRAECQKRCGRFKVEEKKSSMVLPVPMCEGGVRSAVDAEARVLHCPGDQCPPGYKCTGGKCCPANKDVVCKVDHDTGRYAFMGRHTPHYFYKSADGDCQIFTFYGALGNANNFQSYYDCIKYCKGV